MTFALFKEILHRYGGAFAGSWPWALAALVISCAYFIGLRSGVLQRLPRAARWGACAAVALLALAWAWKLRWLCDDAFITFRYAENWAAGRGPVFNPGERVEGYTDFLWMALMTAFIQIGVKPQHGSLILSLGSFLVALLVLDRLSKRLGATRDSGGPGIAALLAAASYLFASFATSGLETMLAAMLALLAVDRAQAGRPLTAGVAGIAATLAHPDHAILYLALAVSLALTPGHRRALGWYLLPFILLYLPYFILKWRYYGDVFPTTYYTKSAGLSYYSQGWVYLIVSAIIAGFWALAPLAAVGAYQFRNTIAGKYFFIATPPYLFYVVKVGGDFMLGRLLIPVMLLFFLFADLGLRHLLARRKAAAWTAILTMTAALAAVPVQPLHALEKFHHVADERTFYPLRSWSPPAVDGFYTDQAVALSRTLGTVAPAPKVAVGCIGIVGYETRLPLFDLYGLISPSVARMPILHRGRPGHEKVATVGHLWAAEVDLAEIPFYPPPFAPVTGVDIGPVHYYSRRYDPRLVAAITRTSNVADFPSYLRQVARTAEPTPSPDAAACQEWFAREYYFTQNPDPAGRRALADWAVDSDSTLDGVRDLLFDPAPLESHGLRSTQVFGFDQALPYAVSGSAFMQWPSTAATPGQDMIFGNRGPFIDSFRPGLLDSATGTMKVPPFVVQGEVMSLMIGGGQDPDRIRVSLLVDRQIVRTATGCRSDVLGRRLWDVAPFLGRTAELEIVDASTEGWGHLVLDQITMWKRSVPAVPQHRDTITTGTSPPARRFGAHAPHVRRHIR